MSVVDLLIAFVVLMGLWRGFQAGAVKTAMSLAAWFMALVIASSTAKVFAPLFVNITNSSVLQISLSFLVIVLVVVSIAHLMTWITLKMLKVLHLSFLDKILGGVLGAAKGILKVLVILSVASPLLVKLPNWHNAVLAQNLLPLAPVAKTLLIEAFGKAWVQIDNPYQ